MNKTIVKFIEKIDELFRRIFWEMNLISTANQMENPNLNCISKRLKLKSTRRKIRIRLTALRARGSSQSDMLPTAHVFVCIEWIHTRTYEQ